jgi:NAD(P)-dependent dehydrogenase (short-subunit alcohol dehydrogenase family)
MASATRAEKERDGPNSSESVKPHPALDFLMSMLELDTGVTLDGVPVVDHDPLIDAIVNNAGIMTIAPMSALKVEEWDRKIDVNIKGVLYGVAAVLPIMQKQKQGQAGSHHQHRFCRGLQSLRTGRRRLQRDEIRRASIDPRGCPWRPGPTTFAAL